MSDKEAKPLRFNVVFSWGGVVVALLGLLALISGDGRSGLLLIAAGVTAWLFAKRRGRRVEATEA
jgi:hypothetical protein